MGPIGPTGSFGPFYGATGDPGGTGDQGTGDQDMGDIFGSDGLHVITDQLPEANVDVETDIESKCSGSSKQVLLLLGLVHIFKFSMSLCWRVFGLSLSLVKK